MERIPYICYVDWMSREKKINYFGKSFRSMRNSGNSYAWIKVIRHLQSPKQVNPFPIMTRYAHTQVNGYTCIPWYDANCCKTNCNQFHPILSKKFFQRIVASTTKRASSSSSPYSTSLEVISFLISVPFHRLHLLAKSLWNASRYVHDAVAIYTWNI